MSKAKVQDKKRRR